MPRTPIARRRATFLAATVTFLTATAVATSQPPKAAPEDKPGAKTPKADFTMKSEDFEKELKADKKAAEAKYKGKVLELSGTIESVFPIPYGKGTSINFKPAERFGAGVMCLTDEAVPPGDLAKGQTVRVVAKPDDRLFHPLRSAVVVEKGPDTAVRGTAEQLAKEFTADAEKAQAKCDGKTVVVSGEVAAIRTDPNVATIKFVELKGDGKTVIHCRFGFGDEGKTPEKYKPGDKAAFAGNYTFANKDAVVLNDCHPVPAK